jgi:hypothetical protein
MQILYLSDRTAEELSQALFAAGHECAQLTIVSTPSTLKGMPKGYRLIAKTAREWERLSFRNWKKSEQRGLPETVTADYQHTAMQFANGARSLLTLIPLACPLTSDLSKT